MNTETQITISETLDREDVLTNGSFSFDAVIDLRCDKNGNPRPVEESLLGRLLNHFISYEQFPVALDNVGPCEEVNLCEHLQQKSARLFVLTENISQLATLLNIYDIPFESRVFYVVETGKGDFKKLSSTTQSQPQQPKITQAAVAG
ncbi:MAG: hypothetical protein AAF217_10490 [Pseudomonadota bacterium]